MKTILEVPYRSPLIIAEAIKDIIAGKIVCELGCACGDLMIEMEKYAKRVVGIEIDKWRATEAIKRGLNVAEGDILKDDIPEADIYYLWIDDFDLLPLIIKRIKKGIIILGSDPSIGEDLKIYNFYNLDLFNIKDMREREYDEGVKLRQKGIVKLFIIEIL